MRYLALLGIRQSLTRCVSTVLRVVNDVWVKQVSGGFFASHFAGMLGRGC